MAFVPDALNAVMGIVRELDRGVTTKLLMAGREEAFPGWVILEVPIREPAGSNTDIVAVLLVVEVLAATEYPTIVVPSPEVLVSGNHVESLVAVQAQELADGEIRTPPLII